MAGATDPSAEPLLEADEIQGNVLPGFNTHHQTLLGVKIHDAAAARALLAELLPRVSMLRELSQLRDLRRQSLMLGGERPPTPTWLNVCLSCGGLRQLLGPGEALPDDAYFVKGMWKVAGSLGDARDSLASWVVGRDEASTPDLLLILGNDDVEALAVDVERLREAMGAGLDAFFRQDGHVLEGGREHFGFRDGISAPGVRGRIGEGDTDLLTRRYMDPADPQAAAYARPGQPLIWPGQFVFGYPKQQEGDPLHPGEDATGGPPWMKNGSLLVFRRLRQDVPAFRTFVRDAVASFAGSPDLAGITEARFAAMLVGRWPDGTALLRGTPGADAVPADQDFRENYFLFGRAAPDVRVLPRDGGPPQAVTGAAGDPFGRVCPKFAHIRKVNPRDLQTDQGPAELTLTFQVLRRGIAFGRPFDPATTDGDGDRGLLFLCYQTSIEGQFAKLNNLWMNLVDGPEVNGHDMLVGQAEGTGRRRSCLLGSHPLETTAQWVLPTGGGFFFAPSRSLLQRLARER